MQRFCLPTNDEDVHIQGIETIVQLVAQHSLSRSNRVGNDTKEPRK